MSLDTFCIDNNIKLSIKNFDGYSETILKLNKISHDHIIENKSYSDIKFPHCKVRSSAYNVGLSYPNDRFSLPNNFIEYCIVFPSNEDINNSDKKQFLINFNKELKTVYSLTANITKNFGASKNTSPYKTQKCIFKTYDWSSLIICDKEQSENVTIKYLSNFYIGPELEPVCCNRYLMETYIKRLVHHKDYISDITDKLIHFYS